MKDINSKSSFSKPFDRSPPKRDGNFRKGNTNAASLVWKPARSQPLNIRMMTTKEGVSERVIHEQPCKIIDKCNYCPLLDLPYKSQLQQKTNDLKVKITSEPNLANKVIVKDCIASEERFGYRHQIKLMVSEHFSSDPANPKRWIDVGLYNQSLNSVVDIGRCPVQTLLANDIAAFFRTGIRLHNLTIYTPKNKSGFIHSIIIRTTHAYRQAQVIINVTKDEPHLLKPLARELAEKIMNIQGVFASVVHPQLSTEMDSLVQMKKLVGQDEIEETYNEFNIKYSPATYLPANPRLFNKMFHRILELSDLSSKETVVELNCGAGELSCILGHNAKKIIAIDPSETAIKDANKNARNNVVKNIAFYAGPITEKLNELINTNIVNNCEALIFNARDEKFNINSSLEFISKLEPKTIFYLTSSANDLIHFGKELNKVGYKIVFIEPYDTFPGTNKLHSLCFIQKN